ncbi:helix-turn-helix domain-containing protein [Litorihabitans aurantiacus]|uniref:Helix-turn-helix domain-containing protein n=1 Tax=Litorihabitans aurantiacus TaxID=1930061 RepID=A0AA38CWP3_9MICO|nr:hypothetical protein GCM10025875_35300 [Litorihabitans aurantiacus]GMA33610.1 hypothetical protein GCM10025875_36020 [Litorihabitans aurantiacus]
MEHVNESTRLLTADEVVALLGGDLKPETIVGWARAGKIGSVKIGRQRRFTQQDVDRFIEVNHQDQSDFGRSRGPLQQTPRSRASNRKPYRAP